MTKFRIQIGTKMIEDMLNAKPEELDIGAIEYNLHRMVRFSNAQGALTIHQHRCLVQRMFAIDHLRLDPLIDLNEAMYDKCFDWCYHHDDHEGITGDIVAPVKTAIVSETNILQRIEDSLDAALCAARGVENPSEIVRGIVHRYDKAAETLEWVFAMNREATDWNHRCPQHLIETGPSLIEWARSQ